MSTPVAGDATDGDRRRAFGPGARRLLLAAFVAACLGSIGFGVAQAASSGGHRYPAFLPAKTLDPQVDHLLVGTAANPALTVEGLPVEAKTKRFDVRVTVSGPVVPGEGLPYQGAATTSTWTVTMSHATADVPVSIRDFHSVDHLGSVFLMGLVPGEKAPPRVLEPGHTLVFQIRAYELVGEGRMQWAPDHRHMVAEWDYTVEND